MEDFQIIDLYWRREEAAIAETQRKYGAFCYGIAKNILSLHEDAEECVSDTWYAAWNRMPPELPQCLRAFLGRITRNLSIDRWRSGRARKRGEGLEQLVLELEDCVPAPHGTERALEDREAADLISAFLRRLTKESRVIFLRRYWYGESLEAIAAGLGCSGGKVKSSLFRTRGKLRAYLEEEGVAL